MLSSRLTEIVSSLTIAESRKFRKFLDSPFYNENEIISLLYDLIYVNLKNSDTNLSKEYYWRQLYPKVKYNDIKFRRLCSDLGILVRKYLTLISVERDRSSEQFLLLRELNDRGLIRQFQSTEKLLRQHLDSEKKNEDYYLKKFQLENEVDKFDVKQIARKKKLNLDLTDRSLDNFYLIRKLKHFCNSLNYRNVLNLNIPIGMIESLLREIESSEKEHEPAIAIYHTIMLTLQEPDVEVHFFKLKELLKAHTGIFPDDELRECYIYAQNYCIKKINAGDSRFLSELLQIYQELLEKGIIYNNDELLPWDYKNIITLGLRLKSYDWTEKFIRENQQKLPEDFRKNALTYNMAMLFFHKNEYQKVVDLLQELEYQDVYYAVDGRWLLLKTYYELSEFDALDSLLESFRLYLLRQKLISAANKKRYLKLVRYVQQLNKINPDDQKRIEVLRKKIKAADDIAEKEWLLEKLEQGFIG